MSDAIRIRRAELRDAEQLQQVYEHVGTYSGTLQLPFPSVEIWQERLKREDANRIVLVAEVAGVVVGSAGLHIESGFRRRHAAGLGIGVADPYAGKGVGTALIGELVSLADNWLNLLRLELEVFVDNAPALALYRKFGFEIEGTHRASALRNGVYTDVYSMARLHPKQVLVRN